MNTALRLAISIRSSGGIMARWLACLIFRGEIKIWVLSTLDALFVMHTNRNTTEVQSLPGQKTSTVYLLWRLQDLWRSTQLNTSQEHTHKKKQKQLLFNKCTAQPGNIPGGTCPQTAHSGQHFASVPTDSTRIEGNFQCALWTLFMASQPQQQPPDSLWCPLWLMLRPPHVMQLGNQPPAMPCIHLQLCAPHAHPHCVTSPDQL